ncbi:MAG: DUF3300 domain-containing protein [Reyranella sp.]|jgi:hypothetical protein|uniref:DUF3300 domain-containing protein n=1 Tax=Reyranella sp. TaxID=1929291 RepID=UPI001AC7C8AD|nr:DUF3300 domain-containing protein [Reyranella sp.]MBN9537622.1 DUF3300 domain-containing protein [Alphaproteobacteria bacterium]MBR2815813.1 DUF3300 domain-containing protein [Reyranella sp.]
MDRRGVLLGAFAISALGSLWSAAALAQTPPPSTPPQDEKKTLKPEELDQILAPIALYPDSLLSQILMATGYPLEIVEAARWSKANPTLKGDAAVAAVKDKSWDVSVKSLVAFPSVLTQLSDHLEWTQKLGDAMISQQQDVADSIQRLRAKAADAGNLKSGQQQTVTTQGSGADRTIVIEPANPEVIYVPSYNPTWAYGSWPYSAYPPVYYPPPPGYGYGAALATGLLWGVGIAAAGAMFSSWNWGRGNAYVNVNVNRAVNIDNHFDRNRYVNNNNRWQHDPGHRGGVAYRDPATRQQFNQHRPGAAERQQFRGQLANRTPAQTPHLPQGTNRPQANRPQAGAHPQIQNRGNFAQGDRPSALSGVNRGQQVNREAMRGRAQQGRAGSHPNFQRPSGGGFHGGGGGMRGGRR